MSSAEDELAIRRTLALYCRLCDDREFGELAELFSPDGSFTFDGVEVVGRPDVLEWFESNNPPHRGGKHLTLNSVIEIDRHSAVVTSDFVFLRQRAGVIVPAMVGRYQDVFDRDEGQWLITHRVVRMDMTSRATPSDC